MFELHTYRSGTEFPDYFYYQAQTFQRLEWNDSEDYDIEWGVNAPSMHVLVAKGKSLISYTEIIWTNLQVVGQSYKCYGLSGVLTFPAFRKRGFGGQVIDAATALIREDPAADVALLWTQPHNVHFYSEHGWQPMPNMITTTGDPSQPEVYIEEMRMMLFLSARGKQARASFEQGQVYVGEGTW